VHLIVADQLNTYDVLVADDVVFTQGALEEFLGVAPAVTEVEPGEDDEDEFEEPAAVAESDEDDDDDGADDDGADDDGADEADDDEGEGKK
jgi:large subunit ribosomal protein L4